MDVLLVLIIKALETVVVTLVKAMTTNFLKTFKKQRKKTAPALPKRNKGGSNK